MEYKIMIKNCMLGVIVMLAASVLVAGVIGFLVWSEYLSEKMIPMLSVCAIAAVTFVVCITTVNKIPKNKLPILLAMVAVYFVICLLLSTAIGTGTQDKIGSRVIMPFVSAIVAGILGSKKRSKRRK